MKINLEKLVKNVKRVVSRKTAPLFIGVGLSLIPLTANADDVYLKIARKYYSSLSDYNQKIQEVSYGPVFSNLNCIGAGYSKSLNDNLDANIEVDANYQKLDAIKESAGVQEVYGSNSKLEASIEPGLKYNLPISKSTIVQMGLSLPVNFVYMSSTNEDETETSITPLFSIKSNVLLKQNFGSFFISAGISLNDAITKSNSLDLSSTDIFINAGKNLGEKKE